MIGLTATFTAYGLIPTTISKIELNFFDSGNTKLTSISVSPTASNTEQAISLGKEIPEDTSQIRVNVTLNDNTYCYIDDLKLTIQ